MPNSKHIAGLVGPTLIAMTISESEFIQPHLYDTQIAPVVYLSGTLLFVAGLAIVRAHNRCIWSRRWLGRAELDFPIESATPFLHRRGSANATRLLVPNDAEATPTNGSFQDLQTTTLGQSRRLGNLL